MGVPGFGHMVKANVFLEATGAYGTRVTTGGSAIEVNAQGINIDQGVVASKALYAGLSARALYQMGVKWAGRISGEVRYEGLGKLIAAAFGATPTTTGSSTLGYTHTHKVAKTAQGGMQSLCMELDEGGIYAAGGDCTLISGIVIPRFKISTTAGNGEDGIVMWEADVWAKDKTPATGASFTAVGVAAFTEPAFYHQGLDTDLKDGTATTPGTQQVTKISVEIVNPLAERYFIAQTGQGKNMAQPLRNARPDIFWELTQEFVDFSQFNAAKNFSDGELKVSFVSPTDIPSTSPAKKYKITLNTTKAKCLTYTNDTNEWGIVEANSRWQAYDDTNGPLVATLLNGKATAATAGA